MRARSAPRIVYADAFRRLCAARELVHDAYDEALGLERMARAAGMAPHHFLRVFRDVMGITPHRYVVRVRLERARELLARGTPVTETCMSVGFSSVGSFSTLFRRTTGRSPVHYQRHVRALIAVPGDLGRIHVPHCFLARFAVASGSQFPRSATT